MYVRVTFSFAIRKWYNQYHIYEELENLPWYVCLGNHDYGQGNRVGQEWVMVSDNLSLYVSLGNHDYRQSDYRIGQEWVMVSDNLP